MIFDSSIGSGAVRQLLTFASAEALFEGVLLESSFEGEQPAIMPLAAMAAAPKLAPLRKFRRDIPSAACFIWFPFQWKYGGRFLRSLLCNLNRMPLRAHPRNAVNCLVCVYPFR